MNDAREESGPDREFLDRVKATYRTLPTSHVVDLQAVTRPVARRRRYLGIGGVAVAATVATVVSVSPWSGPPETVHPGSTAPVGLERWASQTIEDWVSGGDLVVTVTVEGDGNGRSEASDDASGDEFVERVVTLKVDQQVWRSLAVDRIPSRVVVPWGSWRVGPDGVQSPLWRGEVAPNMVAGHTYLVALRLTSCSADPTAPTSWRILGSDAVWAADDGVVGRGESGGASVNGQASQTTLGTFERRMLNQPIAAVEAQLATQSAATGHC